MILMRSPVASQMLPQTPTLTVILWLMMMWIYAWMIFNLFFMYFYNYLFVFLYHYNNSYLYYLYFIYFSIFVILYQFCIWLGFTSYFSYSFYLGTEVPRHSIEWR